LQFKCIIILFLLILIVFFYVQPQSLTPNQLEELDSPIDVEVLRVNISVLDIDEEGTLTSVTVMACIKGEYVMISTD